MRKQTMPRPARICLFRFSIYPFFQKALSICFVLCLTLCTDAQTTFNVTGTVADDKGNPLSGASISLKGSKIGATSGADGSYSLRLPVAKGILVISYTGFQTKEVAINGNESINVKLVGENKILNEIVVTGYSKQSKRDVTGAVSTISATTIAQTPVTDITGVLQGRVSGVSVDGQGGPGSPQVIRIRGVGTLGDNDPLYVIDGVQIRMGTGAQSQNISNLINPSDIESMTILKDPSLISLYGSEGANGVIVITTKTGKSGAPRLEYNAYAGQEIPQKLPSFITPQQQAGALYNSYALAGAALPASVTSIYGPGPAPVLPDYIVFQGATSMGVAAGDPSVSPSLYNLKSYRIVQTDKTGNNWFKVLFKPAFTQNHQLSLSGANDKSNYALTLGYLDDQGTEVNSYFKRLSLRVNTEFKIQPWLRIGENTEMSYATSNSGEKRTFNTFNNDIGAIYSLSPLLPTYDIAGNVTGTKGSTILGSGNPLISRMNSIDSKSYAESIIGAAYAEIEPFKGLVYTNQIGFQFLPNEYHYFTPGDFQDPLADTSNTFGEGGGYSTDWRWLNKIAYSITINSVHRITAFAGYEAHEFAYRTFGGTTGNLAFPSTNNEYLSSGNSGTGTFFPPLVNGGGDKYTSTAMLANITYSLLDKYLFTATGRRDGSSKFGPDNRFGNFGSVSAGWRISKESFMYKISWINDLKLRASYGTIGNDAIGTGIYEDVYTSDPYGNYDLAGTNTTSMSGYYLSILGNQKIKWETNKTTNIGFDAVILSGLTANFSWFNRQSSGVLYAPPSSGTQGSAASPTLNLMDITNKGVELELGYTGHVGAVKYDMGFNISSYRNKVTHIDNYGTPIYGGPVGSGGGTFLTKTVVGQPVSSFYGYEYEGLYRTAHDVTTHATEASLGITAANALGHVMYKDLNNSNTITDSDRTFLGSPNPKFSYGYDLRISFKNFDFEVFLQGVYGNKIFNYGKVLTTMPNGAINGQGGLQGGSLDTWSPTNPNATLPIYAQSTGVNDLSPSSFYIENGSYMRIKQVQIGYTFPKLGGINRLRIYIQAYNLLTITKYSGQDPEVNDGDPHNLGIDYGTAYPISKKILVGINLGL